VSESISTMRPPLAHQHQGGLSAETGKPIEEVSLLELRLKWERRLGRENRCWKGIPKFRSGNWKSSSATDRY